MDLNALKIFIKIAEQRSFTEAAALLDMTQSGVSRAVSRLEADLGVKLLNRTTRSQSLTPDGQSFYTRCSLLLAELEDAEQQLVARQDKPNGTLKITSPVGFGRSILLPVLARLTKDYPGLEIEVSLTDRMVDLTEEGIDAAIRVGEIPDSRVVAHQLGLVRLVTVASPDYLRHFGKPVTPDDLQHHNCLTIRFVPTGRLYDWRFRKNGRDIRVPVSGNLVLNAGDALLDLAIAGHGIVQSQAFMAQRAISEKTVVPILEGWAATRGPISLIYPQNRHLSSKVRAFRDALSMVTI